MNLNALTAATGIKPGTVLAEYHTGPLSRERLKRYAEASGDLNPLHLDADYAKAAGFGDVIVHGMLGMALLGRLLTENFEPARLLHFSARFTGVVPVDQSLHCRLRLKVTVDGADDELSLDLDALNPLGLAVIEGTARLSLSRSDP